MWWNTRKLSEPIDSLSLSSDNRGESISQGGSSLEYNTEAGPTKYLIGTKHGIVVSVNLRNRKTNNGATLYDVGSGRHHGAIHGCWSPSRPGVVYTTRMGRVLDVWDFFHAQNDPVYSHRLGNEALSSIGVQDNGKLVAVGDVTGSVHLLEVCDSLAYPRPNEKSAISFMFDKST